MALTGMPNHVLFTIDTVRQVFQYTHAAIRNRASNKVAKANDAQCNVQRVSVIWYAILFDSVNVLLIDHKAWDSRVPRGPFAKVTEILLIAEVSGF